MRVVDGLGGGGGGGVVGREAIKASLEAKRCLPLVHHTGIMSGIIRQTKLVLVLQLALGDLLLPLVHTQAHAHTQTHTHAAVSSHDNGKTPDAHCSFAILRRAILRAVQT